MPDTKEKIHQYIYDKKLKDENGVKKVIGFAIVGSMKGFEVIQEI